MASWLCWTSRTRLKRITPCGMWRRAACCGLESTRKHVRRSNLHARCPLPMGRKLWQLIRAPAAAQGSPAKSGGFNLIFGDASKICHRFRAEINQTSQQLRSLLMWQLSTNKYAKLRLTSVYLGLWTKRSQPWHGPIRIAKLDLVAPRDREWVTNVACCVARFRILTFEGVTKGRTFLYNNPCIKV